MKTKDLYLNADYDSTIAIASEILKNNGIVAIPTETVYGLAASAYSEEAIKKVFEAKGRPQDNPLIVHISDFDMLYEVACDIPQNATICANRFWPGPLTMVLKKSGKTADCVSAGLDTVAVRMPSQQVALDIIKTSKLPLAAPSANLSGSPSPTEAKYVKADLDGKIDAIVFGEKCEVGLESTVVSFCCNPPRLLRPGAVTAEQLKELIPNLVIDSAVLAEPENLEKVHSPGMKYKHYAPKTEAILVEGEREQFISFVNNQKNAAAICFCEEDSEINIPKICYGSENNPSSLAKEIFTTLREIDKLPVEKVYIHAPTKSGVGLAVYNRLLRAAGFKVIYLKYILGLTGPTGAGKSSLREIAAKSGFKVVDCDEIARLAVVKDSEGLSALVKAFSSDILFEDGTLNRKKLAEIAFSNKENTELLNKTIFPFIIELVNNEIKNETKVLLDAPTLFESGINRICNKTIAVLANKDSRFERITKRDSLTPKEAMLRINAGKPDDFYKQNADIIIYNNGDINEMLSEFQKIIG